MRQTGGTKDVTNNKGVTNVKQGCKKWMYNFLPHDLLPPNFYPHNPNPYPNPHPNHNSQLYLLKLFLYSLEFWGVKSRSLMSQSDFVPPLFNAETQGVKSRETIRNV